jgi:hypothetical protein
MSDPIPDVDAAFDDDFDFDLPPTVDEQAIRRMEFVSQLLDESVEIPGTEFSIGLDPILGALPVAGDVVSAAFSFYIVVESARLGVSYSTLLRMLGNIAVDLGVGSVPVLGTLFDAFWKANVRNFELALEELAEAADDSTDPDAVTIEVE